MRAVLGCCPVARLRNSTAVLFLLDNDPQITGWRPDLWSAVPHSNHVGQMNYLQRRVEAFGLPRPGFYESDGAVRAWLALVASFRNVPFSLEQGVVL